MENQKEYVHAKDFFPVLIACINEGKKASFRITGFSMWPLLCHRRDSVILNACDVKDLRKGDIVLFSPCQDQYLLHRITRLKNGMMETTGDGNVHRDGVFPVECVLAKVESVERKGKTIRVNALGWRLVFRCWMMLFPVRGVLLRLLRWRAGR